MKGSCKRLGLLKENEIEYLGFSLNIIKPLDVRFLSYFPVFSRILQIFNPVITTLQDCLKNEKDSYCESLFNYFLDLKTLGSICLYLDIMTPVNKVMKTFQSRDIDLEKFIIDFDLCIELLKNLAEQGKGELFNDFLCF